MKLKTTFLCLVALLGAALQANAHAVWATIENGQVHFALRHNVWGESAERFAAYVEGLHPRCGKAPLELGAIQNGARSGQLPIGGAMVFSESRRGVDKGAENFLAIFHAKVAVSAKAAATKAGGMFEIVPRQKGDTLTAEILWEGAPKASIKVSLYWPGHEEAFTANTDEKGIATFALPKDRKTAGVVGIHALYYIEQPVEFEGKTYPKTAHQSTLSFPLKGKA